MGLKPRNTKFGTEFKMECPKVSFLWWAKDIIESKAEKNIFYLLNKLAELLDESF